MMVLEYHWGPSLVALMLQPSYPSMRDFLYFKSSFQVDCSHIYTLALQIQSSWIYGCQSNSVIS